MSDMEIFGELLSHHFNTRFHFLANGSCKKVFLISSVIRPIVVLANAMENIQPRLIRPKGFHVASCAFWKVKCSVSGAKIVFSFVQNR